MSEPRLAQGRVRWRETFAVRLRRARDEGALPPGADVDALTGYIDVLLAGLSARARDGANAQELTSIVDYALTWWDVLTRPGDPVSAGQTAARR